MRQCEAELCRNWTGQGCACEFLGLEPDVVCECCNGDPDLVCDRCGEHDCWAGRYLCEFSDRAGAVKRSEYREAR